MHVLIQIAFKSMLITGVTLALLQLLRRRSAAERSWVAHVGLFALLVMAFAPLALPVWNVESPALFGTVTDNSVALPTTLPASAARTAAVTAAPIANSAAASAKNNHWALNTASAAAAIYAIPAVILLIITFVALGRLIALRARAEVLVDGHWLSSLARAQRRMGFKHGTALLTSNELASPISWGLMRPVILLNTRAVEATDEAEAIIAHELAHVARMDWLKLLLARITTALFWFNPLVWLLAREAHQLREEAADDSVLAADIVDTDYAQLLVGVARHECPGLLLGAHGVAPSKSSLARRVARVLDGKSVRGPVARSFALGVLSGAVLVAAPLAAVTFTPAMPRVAKSKLSANAGAATYPGQETAQRADLPGIIAQGVSASVATASAAIGSRPAADEDFTATSPSGATVRSINGMTAVRSPNGATVAVYPPDAQGRRKVVAVAPNGATAVSYADADEDPPGFPAHRVHQANDPAERAIGMNAAGVTSEYVAALRAASPALRGAEDDDFAGMKAVGVTPDYVRALASAGFANLDAGTLMEARAVGLDPEYVRAMRAAGYGNSLEDFVEMRAVGVTPGYAEQVRRAGYKVDQEKLIELKAGGVDLHDPRNPPPPPAPPVPPRRH